MPLLTSGLAILNASDARHTLSAPFPAQLRTVIATYRNALPYGYSPYFYRGLGTQLSMILLAVSRPAEVGDVPAPTGGAEETPSIAAVPADPPHPR